MGLVILVLGTPGVGKTTLAKQLSNELQVMHVELTDLVENTGYFIGYDVFRDAMIIEEDEIMHYLESLAKSGRSFCYSGVELFLDPTCVNFIFILHCNGQELRKRLRSRGYDPQKIEENVQAENLGIVEGWIRDYYPSNKIFSVDTTFKTPRETFLEAMNIIMEQGFKVS